MKKNLYQILEIETWATSDEIKKSYHHLAKQYHPDASSASCETVDKFKEVKRAYEILSDPAKRIEYDREIQEPDDEYKKDTSGQEIFHRKKRGTRANERDLLAAYWQIGTYILVFALLGLAIEWFIWWLVYSDKMGFSLAGSFLGLIGGLIIGFFWGVDANFKVDTFLGQGLAGRIYNFLRTVLMSLSTGYLLGIFGNTLDYYLYDHLSWLTILFTIFGIIVGSSIGSDGDTIEKIYSKEGRFNLLYTALRGIKIGIITGLLSTLLGLMMVKFGAEVSFIFWAGFFGFVIGDIAGSINPGDLAAYASYTSAYLKNVLSIFLVIAILFLGIIIGTRYHQLFSDLVLSFWQVFSEVVR